LKEYSQIYLKCNSGSCKDAHVYENKLSHLQALPASWSPLHDSKFQLDKTPEIDSHYLISLTAPLRLNLKSPFWCVYLPPHALTEGIEKETEFPLIRFCKCKYIASCDEGEQTSTLKIKVLEVLELSDGDRYNPPQLKWDSLLKDQKTLDRYSNTDNYKEFSKLSISVQGDLGVSVIIRKEGDTAVIVAINEWDFHLDLWHLCSIELSKYDIERYNL